jgi:hypothetical protein
VEITPGSRQLRPLGVVAAYLLLFVLGVMEGILGSFEFPRGIGGVPAMALAFCLLILVTSWLAGRGMESGLGGLVPAAGWLIASLVLALPTPGGSVVVTNSAAGTWYLYGGTLCASVGVGLALRRRGRPRRGPGFGGPA